MAKHTKQHKNTFVYFKLTTDVDWRFLHGLLDIDVPTGEPDKVETTNHGSLNNQKEFEHGLIDAGEATFSVQPNFNTHGSAVTGESELNGLHGALQNSVGTNTVWDVRVVLPKVGTSPSSIPAAPPTDRVYFSGQVVVGSFPIKAPMEVPNIDIKCLVKTRFTRTDVV